MVFTLLYDLVLSLSFEPESNDPSQVAVDLASWRHWTSSGDGLHLAVRFACESELFSAILFSLPSALELVALDRFATT